MALSAAICRDLTLDNAAKDLLEPPRACVLDVLELDRGVAIWLETMVELERWYRRAQLQHRLWAA